MHKNYGSSIHSRVPLLSMDENIQILPGCMNIPPVLNLFHRGPVWTDQEKTSLNNNRLMLNDVCYKSIYFWSA